MATAFDVIKQALLKNEAIGYNDTLETTDEKVVDALENLNNLMASWSAERLFTPEEKEFTVSVEAGTNQITLGTGGDITTRPESISTIFIRDSSNLDSFITVKPLTEFALIPNKSMRGKPQTAYYNNAHPLMTLTLYPVPNQTYSVVIYAPIAFTKITTLTLTDNISIPDEYIRALVFNLAVDISPQYDVEDIQILAAIAAQTKKIVKKGNAQPIPEMKTAIPQMRTDTVTSIYTE